MKYEIRETEETRDVSSPRSPRLSASGIRAMQGEGDVASDRDDRKLPPGDARRAAQDALAERQLDERDILGKRRYASEAAARATMGSEATNLDVAAKERDLGFQGNNYPTYDISSHDEVASVKTHWNAEGHLDDRAVAAYKGDLAHLYGWNREPGAVERDGENIVTARDAGVPVPTELEDASPTQAARYLRDNGRLRIPDDHVEPVRASLEQDIRESPDNYYLPDDPSDEQIARVLERIQGIGLSSGELQELTGESPRVQFAPLDSSTYARYNEGKIKVNQDLQAVAEREPDMIKPLLAHEAVHARYQSETPHDEESLHRYVQEEVEAYRAELEAWREIKDDFYARYPTPEARDSLGEAGQNLLAKYNQLEMQVQEQGWDGFREFLMQKYRRRM